MKDVLVERINTEIAEILGWTEISEVNGVLVGLKPDADYVGTLPQWTDNLELAKALPIETWHVLTIRVAWNGWTYVNYEKHGTGEPITEPFSTKRSESFARSAAWLKYKYTLMRIATDGLLKGERF